jgi:protein disulfide-isomerase A4
LAQEKVPIPLAKVDATAESELSMKYKIQGYPTMLVFRKGRHYEYKGGRQVHGIFK